MRQGTAVPEEMLWSLFHHHQSKDDDDGRAQKRGQSMSWRDL